MRFQDFNISRRALMGGAASLALVACSPSKDDSKAASTATGSKTMFNIGWSIYAGWMPWPFAQTAGLVKKHADKYGITINIVQINDYVESVNQYTAGKLDGVTVASMDALTIPAAGGKDTTALIVGDYSNGNDGLVSKNAASVADMKGKTVNLVELSVSHYLLARALDSVGLKLSDVKTVNTSDADIVSAFNTSDVQSVVTWKPQLSEVAKVSGANTLFDSSKIPGEILDLLVVDTKTLAENPNLGKALVDIWYETMAIISGQDDAGKKARETMGKLSGTDLAGFEEQLATTFMYYKAEDAIKLVNDPSLVATMDKVRQFSFSKGLYGPTATSVDAIGIAFPGDKVLGDKANIKLRFDPSYMAGAVKG
jgi:NitT/TauT family transport system substrate-binding protein